MSVADKIGLLPLISKLADHGMWPTLGLCLLITPVAMFVLAPIGESRWLPASPKKQFLSFFPGDILLGLMTWQLLLLARHLPAEQRWYNSVPWHLTVFVGALVVAVVMTVMLDLRSEVYSKWAVLSPTKLYHNFALYWLFGYVVFTTLTSVLFGSVWTWELAETLVSGALLPFLGWIALLWVDNHKGLEGIRQKAVHAHDENWTPIWYGWPRLLPRSLRW